MAVEAGWFRAFVERSLQEVAETWSAGSRSSGHVEGMTTDIGEMFAVVHGGQGALAGPHAS